MRALCLLAVLAAGAPAAAAERSVKDAPRDLRSRATIAGPDEPGERLVLSGAVVGADRKPLAGAVVYAFHTDARGSYGRGNFDPRLYGYARTDAAGRFTLDTIRPGPYPQGGVPAHIHVEVALGGRVHVDECWFEGDPYLHEEIIERERARGPLSAIVRLRRDGAIWRGDWTIAAR